MYIQQIIRGIYVSVHKFLFTISSLFYPILSTLSSRALGFFFAIYSRTKRDKDHQHACQTWSYHPSQTSFHISLICLNSHIIDVSPLLFPLQLEMRYQINQPLVNTIFHKALTCLTFLRFSEKIHNKHCHV